MLIEKSHYLNQRDSYTLYIAENPYDCESYLQRAACYEKLGYPDLAAGDAYRALLLTDELLDESGEWHELAVEALENCPWKEDRLLGNGAENRLHANGALSKDDHCDAIHDQEPSNEVNGEEDEGPWYNLIAKHYARRSYETLARTLLDCGDLKAAYDFTERSLIAFPGDDVLKELQEKILSKYLHTQIQKDPRWQTSDFNPR